MLPVRKRKFRYSDQIPRLLRSVWINARLATCNSIPSGSCSILKWCPVQKFRQVVSKVETDWLRSFLFESYPNSNVVFEYEWWTGIKRVRKKRFDDFTPQPEKIDMHQGRRVGESSSPIMSELTGKASYYPKTRTHPQSTHRPRPGVFGFFGLPAIAAAASTFLTQSPAVV